MSSEADIDYIYHLSEICELVSLSTINLRGYPETRVLQNLRYAKGMNADYVDFFANNQDFYFNVYANSPKTTQIRENPQVSLYFYHGFESAILFGTAEMVEGMAVKHALWQKDFAEHYPQGEYDPNYGILRVMPTAYKYYDAKMQKCEGNIVRV